MQQSTVIFDSRKRDSGTWDNLTVSFARTVSAKQVRVNFISFFNTFHNVATHNGTFTIGATNLTIPPGQYTAAALAQQLDVLVKTVNGLYFVTLVNNAFLTWSIGGDILVGGSAGTLLGTKDVAVLTGNFTTLPALTYPDEIYIRSKTLIRRDHLETDQEHHDSFFYTVLVDAPVLAQVTHRPYYEQWLPIYTIEGRQHFHFELTDSSGRKLQGYPTEWIMSLTFIYN